MGEEHRKNFTITLPFGAKLDTGINMSISHNHTHEHIYSPREYIPHLHDVTRHLPDDIHHPPDDTRPVENVSKYWSTIGTCFNDSFCNPLKFIICFIPGIISLTFGIISSMIISILRMNILWKHVISTDVYLKSKNPCEQCLGLTAFLLLPIHSIFWILAMVLSGIPSGFLLGFSVTYKYAFKYDPIGITGWIYLFPAWKEYCELRWNELGNFTFKQHCCFIPCTCCDENDKCCECC